MPRPLHGADVPGRAAQDSRNFLPAHNSLRCIAAAAA